MSGLSGGPAGCLAYRADALEFCRKQIISLNFPAHAESFDWPSWPTSLPRSGAFAPRRATAARSNKEGC